MLEMDDFDLVYSVIIGSGDYSNLGAKLFLDFLRPWIHNFFGLSFLFNTFKYI